MRVPENEDDEEEELDKYISIGKGVRCRRSVEAAKAFSQPMIDCDRVCVYSGGASALFCMASVDLSPKATPRTAMRKTATTEEGTPMTYAPLRHRGGACNGNKDAEEDDTAKRPTYTTSSSALRHWRRRSSSSKVARPRVNCP